jgi:hypothetical protein
LNHPAHVLQFSPDTCFSTRTHVIGGTVELASVELNHFTNGKASLEQIQPSSWPGFGPYLSEGNRGA